MARGSKKDKNVALAAELNPEAEERNRLKKLAFAKDILSETAAAAAPHNSSQLNPSKIVIKHHGKDILKKSQRKNKFLFSFPGLLAPVTGGKIGELKDLGTKNPILYLDFPQGQMKLFGTIVYPNNRYLILQFSRGGKNVMCEDYFDAMIVFSDAWWIGKKDENPDEARLEFPKELIEGQEPVEYDFKGGAGATSEIKQGVNKVEIKYLEEQSPKTDLEEDISNGENNSIDLMKATPVRHSKRTAKKTYNFAEVSSGGSSVDGDADISEEEKKVGAELGSSSRNHTLAKTENFSSVVLDTNKEEAAVSTHLPGKVPESTSTVAKGKKTSQSAMKVTDPAEIGHNNQGSLVQATISTLFKKAQEKAPQDSRKPQSPKVSGHNLQDANSKRKIPQADGPRKKSKVIAERKAGTEILAKKKQSEIEDDIEDFSSTSHDTDGSDEDWAA